MSYDRLNLQHLRVFPLEERKSLTRIQEIVIDPDEDPPPAGEWEEVIRDYAKRIQQARESGSSVMLTYGAHLIRNGLGPLLIRMMEEGWITHLATNGAGIIHDWEYSHQGKSTENVRENVAQGIFGTWDETGKFINLAIAAGGIEDCGLGEAIGRFIWEDEILLPDPEELEESISDMPCDPLTASRADLLQVMKKFNLPGDEYNIPHPWKDYSVPANAYRLEIPFTVHPGIGYDIISNHPFFSPAAIGRAAGIDFQIFAQSVYHLKDGVYISVGSAIMSPQVFEKALSCANNLHIQHGDPIDGHSILVVDIQENGGWDWSQGEPPKDHPAYYLRFCKSFARMGGKFEYVCADNRVVIHNLYHALR